MFSVHFLPVNCTIYYTAGRNETYRIIIGWKEGVSVERIGIRGDFLDQYIYANLILVS